ncbi:MAG: hypothetical protein Q9163_003692 [Psora crenata]
MAAAPAAKRRRLSAPEKKLGENNPTQSGSKTNGSIQDEFFRRAAGWNLEQDYEQRPRKQKKGDRESTRLPIKTADGKVEPVQVAEVEEDEADSWQGIESEEAAEAPGPEGVPKEEPKVPLRQHILDVKEELARIASHINEEPEEHAGGFRALGELAATPHPMVKKLALATQLAVFKDAIPGYRIRPMAEADLMEKVSKEVKRLRAYEQSLVSAYQAYLKDLAQCAADLRSEPSNGVASVAISCACALLLAVPHFNFRGELLKILVTKIASRKHDGDWEKCLETIEAFFRNDEDGTPSLDAVSLITRMMKARNYQVDERVLNTFMQLKLLSEFSSKASQNHVDKPTGDDHLSGKKPKFKKEFRTKKQRKLMKQQKVVEKDFKEADAIVSHEQRDKMQAETLKLVFVTYFRILKARLPHLMGAVLEGLAKYAHLINQDFFGDLLEVLKDLVNDAEAALDPEGGEDGGDEVDESAAPPTTTTNKKKKKQRDLTREALLCITTAFTLLEGQDAAKSASSLNLDLTFFTKHLYNSLHALALNPDIELSSKSLRLPDPHSQTPSAGVKDTASTKVNVRTTAVLLLRALSSILTPRFIPPIRVAAFSKQLYTSSLHLPEKSNLALLGLLHSVARSHGRKIAALWNTEERKGDGVFDPYRADLEGSNPFASTIWEGELLKLHYSPGVREGLGGVERAVLGTVK